MGKHETFGCDCASMTGDQWVAWAELYELASMGTLATSKDFANALASGDYAAACSEAAGDTGMSALDDLALLETYEGRNPDEVFHELRRERTRLFVGERKPVITPYAGVWHAQARGQQGVLMVGQESMAIERFMGRCGVAKDLSQGQANDPVDHIGTLCEFMQYLCLAAGRAIAAPEGVDVGLGDAVEFREGHFAPYATWCAKRLRAEARIPYYQFLASLLEYLS